MFKSLWPNLLHWGGLFIVLKAFSFHSRQMVLLKFWMLGIQNKWHDKRSRCHNHNQTVPGDPWGTTMGVPLFPPLPALAHGLPLKHLLQRTLWANGCLQGMMWKVPGKLPPLVGMCRRSQPLSLSAPKAPSMLISSTCRSMDTSCCCAPSGLCSYTSLCLETLLCW